MSTQLTGTARNTVLLRVEDVRPDPKGGQRARFGTDEHLRAYGQLREQRAKPGMQHLLPRLKLDLTPTFASD
jgi:hypothetical protein